MQRSAQKPQESEFQFIGAAADGVAPAAVLKLGGEKGPRYLFNSPEGFSRLVLEHRARPGSGLRAVFGLGDPLQAFGGVAGLILRLKEDGHKKIELFGPQGSLAAIVSLQHFLAWDHPEVVVTEVREAPAVIKTYEDENIHILPLMYDLQSSEWQPPDWLELGATSVAGRLSQPGDVSPALRESVNSVHENGDKHRALSSSSGSSSSEDGDHTRPMVPISRRREATFATLDELLLQAASSQNHQAILRILKGERLQDPNRPQAAPQLDMADSLRALGEQIGEQQLERLPNCRNPVFSRQAVLTRSGRLKSTKNFLWGYALCMAAGERDVFLVIHCPEAAALSKILRHPIQAKLPSDRVKAVLHFSPRHVTVTEAYRSWLEKLPGQQVLMYGPTDEVGFKSSARTHMKLRCLAPTAFPLAWKSSKGHNICGEEGNEHVVSAQLLMKLRFGGAAAGIDASECEALQGPEEIWSELLEERPQLSAHVKNLKSSTFWNSDADMHRREAFLKTSFLRVSDHSAALLRHQRAREDQQMPAKFWAHLEAAHPGLSRGTKRAREESQGGQLPHWASEDIPLPEDESLALAEDKSLTSAEAFENVAGCIAEGRDAQVMKTVAISDEMPAYLQAMRDAGDATAVRFLGTGCAEPSKYRGSSAIHLVCNDGIGLLIDAGEGAFGQMVRHHGLINARKQVDRLAAVFVSHKHADHMLGLPGILRQRSSGSPPLLVVGPRAAQRWLMELQSASQLRFDFIPCSACASEALGHPKAEQMKKQLGLRRAFSVPVHHCSDAWALVLEHLDGWSLCFSGDTRPCAKLAEAARGCTLLIHEATFEPDRLQHAVKKLHSTTTEALWIAERAGAYRTILTHFSQRNPKLPAGIMADGPVKAGVAFDGMFVRFTSLPDLPRLLPALQCAFEEDETADDAAAVEVAEANALCRSSGESLAHGGLKELLREPLAPQEATPTPPNLPCHIHFDD